MEVPYYSAVLWLDINLKEMKPVFTTVRKQKKCQSSSDSEWIRKCDPSTQWIALICKIPVLCENMDGATCHTLSDMNILVTDTKRRVPHDPPDM